MSHGEQHREADKEGQWHLDKKVPLALIITIVAQTIAISWGASNLWTRVSELERQVQIAAPQFERVIRLEAKVDAMNASLAEIKTMIRRDVRQ